MLMCRGWVSVFIDVRADPTSPIAGPALGEPDVLPELRPGVRLVIPGADLASAGLRGRGGHVAVPVGPRNGQAHEGTLGEAPVAASQYGVLMAGSSVASPGRLSS
jgi:hypothetical protein